MKRYNLIRFFIYKNELNYNNFVNYKFKLPGSGKGSILVL